MKISRLCAAALVLMVGTAMSFADGIDPKIIIHGVLGGSPIHCSPEVCQNVGLNFTFGTPASGSGTLFFTNNSGVNWTSLKLIETNPVISAANIKCASYLFKSCTTTTLPNGSVEILLQGVKGGLNKDVGIRAGQSFSIQFACINNGCWPGGLDFGAHANSVPEPGTVALLMTGLGGIISRRKLWRNRFTA
jgi:PEP-CTERM motif